MERKGAQKIDSLLQLFVKANRLEKGLAEYRLTRAWGELLGPSVTRITKSVKVRQGKLFVTLHSSVMRNELEMMKDALIPRLNQAAGMEVIDDIILR